MAKKTRKTMVRLALAGTLPLVLISFGVLAGWTSITLPNGAELRVSVDDPVTCTEFQVPHDQSTIDVPVTGTASVGLGEPDGTLVYVIDVSASTNRILAGGDCGGDTNGDGISDMVLDCEIAAVLALNGAAIPEGSIDEVGVVVYGETGAAGDMTPGGGDDPITAPDANGDVAAVLQSVRSYYDGTPCPDAGLRQFTSKSVGCNGTDFSAGLAAAKTVVDASTNGTNIVIFLSDGLSNQQDSPGFNNNLSALLSTGAVIYSFAVGDEANCSGGGDGTLQQMANASQSQNGAGACTNVVTPADLPDILPDLIGSTLESLEIEVDGGGKEPVTEISLPLPQPGAVSVDYYPTVMALGPGDHDICVTANGSDVTLFEDSVTQCETIHLLQLAYGAGTMPDDINATNDLNFQTEHTVTVQIAGGTGDDRDIDFEVTGHNAGAVGSESLSPPDTVSFAYSVPQDCASLGSDTITASTVIAGVPDSIVFTKEWIDAVPPNVSCDESVNPHGDLTPPSSNQDGFYQLNAEDPNIANCTVTLMVMDGDGYVFPGPFLPGDIIKYTQADGAPQQQKKIGSNIGDAGAVKWHLKGHGDLTVFAEDPSGNVSSASCLVPPPPM